MELSDFSKMNETKFWKNDSPSQMMLLNLAHVTGGFEILLKYFLKPSDIMWQKYVNIEKINILLILKIRCLKREQQV